MSIASAPNDSDHARLQALSHDLQEQLVALEQEQADLLVTPIRVGVIGTRGACKTSMFATWGMFGTEDTVRGAQTIAPWRRNGATIDLQPDEQTKRRLNELADDIRQNGTATATASAKPDAFTFRLCVVDGGGSKAEHQVETRDYTGRFLKSLVDDAAEIAAEARQFIRECDFVLCLTPYNGDALETSEAIDRCFENQTDVPKHMLAITKFDEVMDVPADRSEEEQCVKQLVAQNQSLKALISRLEMFFPHGAPAENTTMLIAPLGDDFGDGSRHLPLDRDDLRPFNICGPVIEAFASRRRKITSLRTRINQTKQQIELNGVQIDRLQEIERGRHIQDLEYQLDRAVEHAVDAELEPGSELVLDVIATQAMDLEEMDLAERAYRAAQEMQDLQKYQRKLNVKTRLAEIEAEIERGGLFKVTHWVEGLQKLLAAARELDDQDLVADIEEQLGQLEPRQSLLSGLQSAGGKGLQAGFIFAVVIGAICIAAVGFWLIQWIK